jgi:outer membrane usher protein
MIFAENRMWLYLLLGGLGLAASPVSAQSELEPAPSAARSPVASLNLPALLDGVPLGQIQATVSLEEVLFVSAEDLARTLGTRLDSGTLARLHALGPGQVSAEDVRATGLDVGFDPSSITLRVTIPPSLRGPQTFSSLGAAFAGLEPIEPSRFAVGITGSLVTTSRIDRDASPETQLIVSGFANFGGVEGVNLLFGGDARLTDGSDFRRDRLVAFKDNPARALRYSAGDIAPLQARLAGQTDMLGFSIERNYAALQPLRNVRSTGRRSLVLQRRSTVEIYVNGALVQTFVADPGPIDIRDIPLADLSSDISIVVEDDLGRRELETFSAGADLSLLAEGVSEFNASAGFLRDGFAGDLTYSADPVVSLFYARGLRQDLTVTGHAVITTSLQNIGGSVAWARPEGIALIETALSHADDGAGLALGLSYRGDPFGQEDRDGLLNLRAEHRTAGFREAVGAGFSDSLKLDVAADYRIRLTERATVNAGAAYFTSHRDRTSRSASAGLTYDWGALTNSATIRYSKQSERGDEVGVFFSVSMPFGARSYGYASHDTVSDTTRAEFRRRRSLDYPAIDLAARALQRRDELELGGRIGLETARYDAALDVSQFLASGSREEQTVGTLRLQSGLAYVDGRFGTGRDPGRGFLMVSRHPSLETSPVEVKSSAVGRALGRADLFGPAVVPVVASYRPQEIRVNPLDLPPGYDIGPGGYVISPGATSGLSIRIGDEAYRIAVGRLMTEEGEPITLRTGRLVNLTTGDAQPFFTNAQGRISLNRLAPGRYRIEVDVSDWVHEIEIGERDPALISLGNIAMSVKP